MSEIGLRERQRVRTRASIQEHALRLFLERGYDATTVAEVAAAAAVSSMTVFRHFPTKEDLVVADDYDPLIVERIVAQPTSDPPIRRIAAGLLAGVGELSPSERALLLARLRLVLGTPALRARQWDGQYATQRAIVAALDGSADELELWVGAGACLAAASAAVVRWTEQDGRPDVRQLMADALAVLTSEDDARG
jgi:AcrR family transcriptional regulator